MGFKFHSHLTPVPQAPGSRLCKCLIDGGFRCSAGRDAGHTDELERRERAAVERDGEGGAAGVGDVGAAEEERLELRQHPSRRRRRTRRRWSHEGKEARVAERAALETESLQRGQPPQGRREGHQPRVADGGGDQIEGLKPRQGASAQGGGERRGACVAHVHVDDAELGHGRQRARAQPLRQPLHAVGAGCWLEEDQRLERW
eukprot:scaffold8570_cov66-Phaeocystis_antarctica.AAC.2